MRSHRQVAVHLDALGLPVTYLAPGLYMENFLAAADTIREDGMIAVPAGQGRVWFVAASDVAAVAARVLTSRGHEDTAAVREVTGADPRPIEDWLGKSRGSFLGWSPDLPGPAF